MRLLPLLRATLGGLDAFDSAGMAVSFVVSFSLALEGDRRQEHVNAALQVPTGVRSIAHTHTHTYGQRHACHEGSMLLDIVWRRPLSFTLVAR